MSNAATIAYYVGYLLLVLTAVSSVRAAWRYRDAHHLNILAFVLALVLLPQLQLIPTVHAALLLIQPYFLLRLVEHFRDVPRLLSMGALVAVAVGVAFAGITGLSIASSPISSSCFFSYIALLEGYAAIAFSTEARRKGGVTSKRLLFAATGTWLFAAVFALLILAQFLPDIGRFVILLRRLLVAAGLICYFLAFSTPRRLRASWQGAEQAKYLTDVAPLDPVERGRRAPDDLAFVGARSVGNAVTLVAVRDALQSPELRVRAASDPVLVGLHVRPADGVFGRVTRTLTPVSDRVSACEAEVVARVRPYGQRVLAAPIATTTNNWGVVLVVQRHGSLFP
ncbi:MAG TPA: hypothetical protein VF424_05840, partial [Vicinamibacterales bacterium]